MLSALGKLIKFIIILIAIIIGIAFFTGTETSFSDENTSSDASISESKEQCEPGYYVSGNRCIKATSNNKADRWWEKTDKYAICYGRVTQAHKENGLHDRNRDMSVKMKKEICKIAATSTTGEGSFWIE